MFKKISKKVKILSLAQIGLQEHSKNMVGNAAVLINGYNQFGDYSEMITYFTSCQDVKTIRTVFVVHGDNNALEGMREHLQEAGFNNIYIPQKGEITII